MKQLLIVDNDDQTDAIQKINKICRDKNLPINCFQFNVGLPDGNDVINENGRIDLNLVSEKYEQQFGSRRFNLIAFDFKLNEPEGGIDGITLIQKFNAFAKTQKTKKVLYSSELNEIVQEYLSEYKKSSDYDKAWGKFKTLITLEILDFCKRDDYEGRVVSFIEKTSDQEDDFIVEELIGSKDLSFNPSIEIYKDLNFDEIAEKIIKGDSQSLKFKKKLIELAVAHLAALEDGQ